jgi:hypothetical protein
MINEEKEAIENTLYKVCFESIPYNSIFLLSEVEASNLWSEYISINSRSYFDLHDNCWVIKSKQIVVGDWLTYYNTDDNDSLTILLKKIFNWADEELIRFFANRNCVIETNWKYFLKYWDCFLAVNDDCPIVIPNDSRFTEAILFKPNGHVLKIFKINDCCK